MRLVYKILTFLLLLATWVVLSGYFDVAHLTMGVLCAGFVTILSSDLVFESRQHSLGERVMEAVRLPGYGLWLIWQIVLANIHVFKLALSPSGIDEIEPQGCGSIQD